MKMWSKQTGQREKAGMDLGGCTGDFWWNHSCKTGHISSGDVILPGVVAGTVAGFSEKK